jgi:hypothetical protein
MYSKDTQCRQQLPWAAKVSLTDFDSWITWIIQFWESWTIGDTFFIVFQFVVAEIDWGCFAGRWELLKRPRSTQSTSQANHSSTFDRQSTQVSFLAWPIQWQSQEPAFYSIMMWIKRMSSSIFIQGFQGSCCFERWRLIGKAGNPLLASHPILEQMVNCTGSSLQNMWGLTYPRVWEWNFYLVEACPQCFAWTAHISIPFPK